MRYNFKYFLPTVASVCFLLTGCTQSQRTFRSPEDAINALADAVQKDDNAELRQIFGPEVEDLKSDDPEQDREDILVFSRRLATAHKIRTDSADHATVLIGQEEWPFAVPLVKKGSGWRFDTDAGLEELTNRRIGRNELLTIAACRTLIDAQKEFYDRDPDGLGYKHYAQRLMSYENMKNGLYWPSPGGVDPSPIGPVMAQAARQVNDAGDRIPFNGYLFKLLSRQTAAAPGGELDYMQNGELTRGWAVLAYPAEYGVTGITSFLCSSHGEVYQQDLGDDTEEQAGRIYTFDPDPSWKIVPPAANTAP